jgi:hypothetical protein
LIKNAVLEGQQMNGSSHSHRIVNILKKPRKIQIVWNRSLLCGEQMLTSASAGASRETGAVTRSGMGL